MLHIETSVKIIYERTGWLQFCSSRRYKISCSEEKKSLGNSINLSNKSPTAQLFREPIGKTYE